MTHSDSPKTRLEISLDSQAQFISRIVLSTQGHATVDAQARLIGRLVNTAVEA